MAVVKGAGCTQQVSMVARHPHFPTRSESVIPNRIGIYDRHGLFAVR